ncbi:MAG TPA: FAD-dependent oxidoreductase [Candidatus Krumholzibacteria bacterium]|nr:FAD-dependent oxidoreductase [Candidatus Krumholzibacteria bacterium]HPD70996.1 FAD-dependent oxidoreductase [Candidatus Krumholzibacteria bacterium]HRY39304.1 FAD-dependent oxidoreductase [Candidatus Krumholzibacteria bacterium]
MALSPTCDLAVLGSGPGAAAAARRGVDLGLRTAQVAGAWRLAGPGRFIATGAGGGPALVVAGRIVLAAESRPVALAGATVDGHRFLDGRGRFTAGSRLPSVVVVGGGAAGLEWATACAAAGARVTLVEMSGRLLPEAEPAIAQAVLDGLGRAGVAVRTATRAIRAAPAGAGVTCKVLDLAARTEATLAAAALVIAIGRRPKTRDLGLETVTVETDRFGHLLVDANQETATHGLYAIGDMVSPRVAEAADREAVQAVDHAAGRPRRPIRYREIPRCLATEPPVAMVGLSAEQARLEGHLVSERRVGLSASAAPDGRGAEDGFAIACLDAESGRPLGVQVVGPRAPERLEAIQAALAAARPGA